MFVRDYGGMMKDEWRIWIKGESVWNSECPHLTTNIYGWETACNMRDGKPCGVTICPWREK